MSLLLIAEVGSNTLLSIGKYYLISLLSNQELDRGFIQSVLSLPSVERVVQNVFGTEAGGWERLLASTRRRNAGLSNHRVFVCRCWCHQLRLATEKSKHSGINWDL